MTTYFRAFKKVANAFEMRYQCDINPDANRWELCSKVLSRKDVIDKLSEAW